MYQRKRGSKRRKRPIQCTNCGEKGHMYKTCTNPIISCGVIAWRLREGTVQYLCIERMFSMAFLDIIRGKFQIEEGMRYLVYLLSWCTRDELNAMSNAKTLRNLWEYAEMNPDMPYYIKEFRDASMKFAYLMDGVLSDSVAQIFHTSTIRESPGWGFPKGKRNAGETDHQCGIREFCEETSYAIKNFKPTMVSSSSSEKKKKIMKVRERFVGNNGLQYEYRFFVYRCVNKGLVSTYSDTQPRGYFNEVRDVRWFERKEILKRFERPEQREMFLRLDRFIDTQGSRDNNEFTASRVILRDILARMSAKKEEKILLGKKSERNQRHEATI